MTENEALKELNVCIGECVYRGCGAEAMHEAILALNEIQQYRSIGTVEECRDAVERNKDKKVKGAYLSSITGIFHGDCPVCGKGVCANLENEIHSEYCNYCGQHISWEESEGEDD